MSLPCPICGAAPGEHQASEEEEESERDPEVLAHAHLSRACAYGAHAECRNMCRICTAHCSCPCHREP